MTERLTDIQERVLRAIQERLDRGEAAPTYRELCAEFGWSSTGTARDHLRALRRKGHLQRSSGRRHREVRLCQEAPVTRVPLLGRVVAGLPVTSQEDVEGHIPVPAHWTDRNAHYAVRVAGDSMIDAGILDGDCVIVRHQQTAGDGDIVVATLDGETTLKRLRRRGKHVTLLAENPRYQPIEVSSEAAVLQGVVVGLQREYASRDRHGRKLGPRNREVPA